MIDKKIAEVLPGNFIMNHSPDNLLDENNKPVNEKKVFHLRFLENKLKKL